MGSIHLSPYNFVGFESLVLNYLEWPMLNTDTLVVCSDRFWKFKQKAKKYQNLKFKPFLKIKHDQCKFTDFFVKTQRDFKETDLKFDEFLDDNVHFLEPNPEPGFFCRTEPEPEPKNARIGTEPKEPGFYWVLST